MRLRNKMKTARQQPMVRLMQQQRPGTESSWQRRECPEKCEGKDQSQVEEGFAALDRTPEWFQWAMYASIGASFGIRGIKGIKK